MPKENQPGILGISSREFMHYIGNSAESLGSARGQLGLLSSENTPKLCRISPQKVATTLRSGLGKGAVGA